MDDRRAVRLELLGERRRILRQHGEVERRARLLGEVLPRGDGVEGGLSEISVGLGLGDDEDGGHGAFFPQMTLASFFSLVNSSCTSPTLMPALRGGGADIFTTSTCSVVSTPSVAGVSSSIGLLFAFMMPGSEA